MRQVTRDAISDLCTDTVRHKYPVARPDILLPATCRRITRRIFSVQGSLVDFNTESVRNLTRLIDMSLSGQRLRDATSRQFSRRIFRNDKNLA